MYICYYVFYVKYGYYFNRRYYWYECKFGIMNFDCVDGVLLQYRVIYIILILIFIKIIYFQLDLYKLIDEIF